MEDTRTPEEKAAAEERYQTLNPFIDGQMATLRVQVIDARKFFSFIGANLYGAPTEGKIPGGELQSAGWVDFEGEHKKILDTMQDILRANGRYGY